MARLTKRHRGIEIRKTRTRRRLAARSDQPRLTVFRSHQHMYAQIVDDLSGKTLVEASTRSKELREKLKKTSDKEAAKEVGKLLGERAKKSSLTKVCFDRGGYRYHGRVQALAEGARESGLQL